MNDLISREVAINTVLSFVFRRYDATQEEAEAIRSILNAVPEQPDKSVIEDCLYHIRRNTSSHTSAEGVVAIKHYMGELWRELFGEEDVPEWMI